MREEEGIPHRQVHPVLNKLGKDFFNRLQGFLRLIAAFPLLSNWEAFHSLIVGRLGVGERETRVDLQRLPCGMSRVGLDQGIINPLFFEPGEEKMPPLVRRH